MPFLDITDCLTAPAGVLTPFAPTTVAAHINTASYIDRLIPMDDGLGQVLDFYLNISTGLTSGGSATVDFQLLGNATDPTFASGNVVMASTGPLAYTTYVLGYQACLKISQQAYAEYQTTGTQPRYYALNMLIGTAVLTAGAVNAWMTIDRSINSNLQYKAGYNV